MRMRHKKNGAERIAACSNLLIPTPPVPESPFRENGKVQVEVALPQVPALDPSTLFPVSQPIHLEIGCGKGGFAIGMAEKYPEVNFLAMEKVSDVCCIALERTQERAKEPDGHRFENLRYLIGNAEHLPFWLPPHSVDCIYLNFSDPWPKKGYAKRRLTYRSFLSIYQNLLVPGGILKLKTDNDLLFASSIEEFELFGLEILFKTDDLHATERQKENVMTEYEAQFAALGKNIHAADVRF